MSSACDHADDGPCTGGPGHFEPTGTDLTLCRRHYNRWRLANGKQVASATRPRYPDGEAIPRVMTLYLYSDEWEEDERELHVCESCLHHEAIKTDTIDEFNEICYRIVGQVYPRYTELIFQET